MSDEEVTERRSMVGAPPSSSSRGAVAGTSSSVRPGRSSTRVAAKPSGKRKRTEDTDDDEEHETHENGSEAGDQDDSADEVEDMTTPGKPRKKRRRGPKPLTDAIQRKKRSEAKKAAEREAKLAAGYESPEEEKPLTPVPEEPPEPIQKTPSLSKYSPFQLMCDHLLRKVQSKDPEEYFAVPVTQSMAPDYHTIISNPMDFSTMRNKVEEDLYQSVSEVRIDAELIVSNALSYNNPNTVYHLAATRLAGITRYYFSEQYLRYIFHTLPFANEVPLEKAGLTPLAPLPNSLENKRRLAVTDSMTSEDCLKSADPLVREKLTTRVPAEISFLDNKDGATVLNVIGSTEKKGIRLLDIVGPLDEGNPGMIGLGDHRLSTVSAINYLSYGPFCSFAPQYDSTWASLTKTDSDLLLRTYGDRSTVSDVISLRNMVTDAGAHFMKVVDDMLDTLTDGEHSRAIATLEKKPDQTDKDKIPLSELLSEIESLENLGVDVSFVNDLREVRGVAAPTGIQSQLDSTGRAVMDLARLQHERLSKQPPTTLTKVAPPNAIETQLANNLQHKLAQQVATHTHPSQVVSAPAIHKAIGLQDEFDMDILGEFFVT